MNNAIAPILDELNRIMQQIYGDRLLHLILYGSQARGDMTLESDIDVLVVLRGEVQAGTEISRTGEAVAALSLEYDVVVSCVFISADDFYYEQSPLLLNVRKEGIPML